MTVHVTRWKTGDLSSLTAEIGPMKRTQLQEMNQGITQKLLICSGQTSILVTNWGIQRWTVSRAPEQYWKVSHWDSVRFMNVWPHSVSTWFGCEVFLRSEILDAIFMVGVAGSSSSLTGGAISTILFSVPSVVRLLWDWTVSWSTGYIINCVLFNISTWENSRQLAKSGRKGKIQTDGKQSNVLFIC